MKRMTRMLACLLALCLMVGLVPTGAFADSASKAIQLGTAAIKDPVKVMLGDGEDYHLAPSSYVYFGHDGETPILWRVLDADQSNAGGDGMFLLSEYLMDESVVFGKDNNNKSWQSSNAKQWCGEKVTSFFTEAEQKGLLSVSKSDGEQDLYNISWGTSELQNEQMFFLSVKELSDYVGWPNSDYLKATYGKGGSAGKWYLRSPRRVVDALVGIVGDDGEVYFSGVGISRSVRPACNINLKSVLFTSAAAGGKISDGALSEIAATTTNEWKFTVYDESRRDFSASLQSDSTVQPGQSVSIAYSGATTGADNEYVSVILADADGNALYYGYLANNSASGSASVSIPAALPTGSYTLYVFSEQCNGDYQTDYASALKGIKLNVAVNPLTITRQPTDQYVVEGQRAEFSVEATGDGLTCQWYINRNDGNGWRELDGATGNAYVASDTDLNFDGFQYRCQIMDQHGNLLDSDAAVLHVSRFPVLPETGDSSTPMLWLVMSILSMAGILLLRKKANS